MDNFARTEKFILEHPEDAQALAAEWQEFAEHNPGILPTNTRLLAGKDIVEAYFYIRARHEETQMRNQGSVDLSKVPQSLIGFPAIVAIAFQRTKIMQDDEDYQKIEEKFKTDWLEKNPSKDFASKEGLDYLYGSLDNDNASSLRKDAEKAFRDNPKYQKRIERYDKEKIKIYKHIDDDPAVARLKAEIEAHTKARGGDTNGIIQQQSWERFAVENPDKTKAYAQTNADIKKANEKQTTKKHLAEIEQKTGKQVRYVEKIHRGQGISVEEATRRLESIKPSQTQKEDQGRSQNINVRQITKQLEIQSRVETGIIRPQYPTRSSQDEGFMNQDAGRGIGESEGRHTRRRRRLAGRAGNMTRKLSGRAGKMLGKFAFQIGTKLAANPWTLLIIGVIILIVVIVIIMMSGSGPKPVPTLEGCLDENGNTIVKNGNECAAKLASYYSKEEGAPVSATCLDKCTDSARSLSCDRDPKNNSCDIILYGSCGGDSVFCVKYDPPDPSLNRLYDCETGGPGYIGTPLGVNSCGPTSASTPTPVSPTTIPIPTLAPVSPIPTCIEKIITVTQSGPPPPPSPSCDICGDGSSCCNGSTCNFDPYASLWSCLGGLPPPPASSYSVTTRQTFSNGGRTCGAGQPSTATVPQTNNILVNHNRIPFVASSVCFAWTDTTQEAILNFAGFNIPRNSEIKSATLSSSVSGGCQAAFVSGAANFSGNFSSNTRFGSGTMVLLNRIRACQSRNPVLPTRIECGGSGLSSGTADVKGIVSGLITAQDVTAISFKITPEASDWLCFTPDEARTLFSGNFTVNSPGPASLSVTYCESTTPTP